MGEGTRLRPMMILALCATMVFGAGIAEAKKTKRTLEETQVVNAPIPDATAATLGELSSTITVGRKYRGLKIRDVNVTVHTSGATLNSAMDLIAQLSAPNQASSSIFYALEGSSVGPLTLDDESRFVLGGTPPPASGYFLPPPYQGTAQPGVSILANYLAVMDDGRVRGDWTLRIVDHDPNETSILNSWTLQVQTGRPYETKD